MSNVPSSISRPLWATYSHPELCRCRPVDSSRKADPSSHSVYSTLGRFLPRPGLGCSYHFLSPAATLVCQSTFCVLLEDDINSILLWTGFNLKLCACVASIFHVSLSSFIRMQRARLASLSLCARVLYQLPWHQDMARACILFID